MKKGSRNQGRENSAAKEALVSRGVCIRFVQGEGDSPTVYFRPPRPVQATAESPPPDFPAMGMAFVEVPLNSFRYRFRRLSWEDEYNIKFQPKEDQRITILSHALANVSGLEITSPEDAKLILTQIPYAIFWRLWLIYRANLPADQYFSTRGLYSAPDQKQHEKRIYEDDERVEDQAEAAVRRMEAEHPAEKREMDAVSRKIFDAAKKSGTLVPAKGA